MDPNGTYGNRSQWRYALNIKVDFIAVFSIETFCPGTCESANTAVHKHRANEYFSLSLSRCAPLRSWTGNPTLHTYKYFIPNSILNWGWKKKWVAFSGRFTLLPLAITYSPLVVLAHNGRKPYWKACRFPGRGFPSGWMKLDTLQQLCLLSWKSWACNSPEADSSQEERLFLLSSLAKLQDSTKPSRDHAHERENMKVIITLVLSNSQ